MMSGINTNAGFNASLAQAETIPHPFLLSGLDFALSPPVALYIDAWPSGRSN
jgi:hypothetical protein